MIKDIILGGGIIGKAIAEIVNTNVIIDKDEKISTYSEGRCECLHICIPYDLNFHSTFKNSITRTDPLFVIIHSTVPMGTTKAKQELYPSLPIIYSPCLGNHKFGMAEEIRSYPKAYSCYKNNVGVSKIMMDRFKLVMNIIYPKTLELSKLVETTYLGLLVDFRKLVDELAHDDNEVWAISNLAHGRHKNRPIMYNDKKPIGGHCVIPNLDLLFYRGGPSGNLPVIELLYHLHKDLENKKIFDVPRNNHKKNVKV